MDDQWVDEFAPGFFLRLFFSSVFGVQKSLFCPCWTRVGKVRMLNLHVLEQIHRRTFCPAPSRKNRPGPSEFAPADPIDGHPAHASPQASLKSTDLRIGLSDATVTPAWRSKEQRVCVLLRHPDLVRVPLQKPDGHEHLVEVVQVEPRDRAVKVEALGVEINALGAGTKSSSGLALSHLRKEERWKSRALPFASTDFSSSLSRKPGTLASSSKSESVLRCIILIAFGDLQV
ncbi:hypothetical protein ACFX2B_039252 [Malus domestica]